jgi:hypothetical protein
MVDEGLDVRSNIKPVLADLAAISPAFATNTRRALRQTGEAVIGIQREILESEPVGGVVTSTRYSLARPSARGGYRRGPRARELAGARIVKVESRGAERGRSSGLRRSAAENLTTKVSTPKTRSASVRVASRRPYWANKALNAKKWRHRIFGTEARLEQAGNQYFTRGARAGGAIAREALAKVVDEAVALVKNHPTQ